MITYESFYKNHERQRDDDIQADKGFQHQPQSHRPSQA